MRLGSRCRRRRRSTDSQRRRAVCRPRDSRSARVPGRNGALGL
jgi:hypothetical protein